MSGSGHSPAAVRQAPDRRSTRTLASIDAAFLMLLRRTGYEAVAVSDIVREADVGRATFYEHYASKDDLLRAQLRRVADATLRAPVLPSTAIDAAPLFAHVRDVPMLYRMVGGRSGTVRSMRVLQDVLEERVTGLLQARDAAGIGLPAPWTTPLAARVTVAGLCALLAWWVDTGMAASVDEMQSMFAACSAVAMPVAAAGAESGGQGAEARA